MVGGFSMGQAHGIGDDLVERFLIQRKQLRELRHSPFGKIHIHENKVLQRRVGGSGEWPGEWGGKGGKAGRGRLRGQDGGGTGVTSRAGGGARLELVRGPATDSNYR